MNKNFKKEVIVIGAGKVAYSIANALKNDFKLKLVVSNSLASAERLSNSFGFESSSDSYESIPKEFEGIVLLTVTDNQINSAAKKLSKQEINFAKTIFIHFSGAFTISEMDSITELNGNAASIHIMQGFPKREPINLDGVFASIEYEDDELSNFLSEFVKIMGLKASRVLSNRKAFNHLAGVFTSNFIYSNLYYAEILVKQASDSNNLFDAIGGLLNTCINNCKENGIENSLTGPLVRGDVGTIEKHLSTFNRIDNNELMVQSYIINSLIVLEILEKKNNGLNEGQLKIKELLLDRSSAY